MQAGRSDALVSQVDLLSSLAALTGQQLYDLKTDLGVTRNLSTQHSQASRALAAHESGFLERVEFL